MLALPRLIIPQYVPIFIPSDYPPRPAVVSERLVDRVRPKTGMGYVAEGGHYQLLNSVLSILQT
jgi:hypothetical protein